MIAVQVLIDLMPPTSLVIPMFGRYLITTMILVALSTVVSVVTVNFRFRSGSAHKMSPWIRIVFLNFLPRVLLMSRPVRKDTHKPPALLVDPTSLIGKLCREEFKANNPHNAGRTNNIAPTVVFRKSKKAKRRVDDVIFINLLQQVRFIAEHFQHNEKESEISDDWTFVAMVLDRLFLLIFSVLNVGTMFIILEAPSLYDYSEAMNITKYVGFNAYELIELNFKADEIDNCRRELQMCSVGGLLWFSESSLPPSRLTESNWFLPIPRASLPDHVSCISLLF
ncbi:unnamed protein product [Nippostrongylus brasiliensis]|uniref:Neur_chan_memb domain-containing protein n=1 Tax=Nippostrongylus brasiliensis TaxID=27835 RepID=A0A0N4YT95_NIPBR|nr:unnamed protein product [Nippostrongylus brasiliensis]